MNMVGTDDAAPQSHKPDSTASSRAAGGGVGVNNSSNGDGGGKGGSGSGDGSGGGSGGGVPVYDMVRPGEGHSGLKGTFSSDKSNAGRAKVPTWAMGDGFGSLHHRDP